MSTPAVPPLPENPVEIAREAFKRLALHRIAPTPEAYREAYHDIAGIAEPAPTPPDNGAEVVLGSFAVTLAAAPGELAEFGRRMQRAVKTRDWDIYARNLTTLGEKYLRRAGPIEMVGTESAEERVLRDLLSRTLAFAVATLLTGSPRLVGEAEALGVAVRSAHGEAALADIAARLKELCYQVELKNGDDAEQHELLLRLFKLLLENVNELLDDDSWMRGQIGVVQELITGPLDVRTLEDATRSLKDVIYKQGQVKHGLADVKLTVKSMMMTFIERLGAVAESTGHFHTRIGGFSERIRGAEDIAQLDVVLAEVLDETRTVQEEALRSRARMLEAHQAVQEAEQRIGELEDKLRTLSDLVREDQLTGSLNRRGLDEMYAREVARAERRNAPLCVALLDLDDFKKLNDTHGHIAGDNALKHLVMVVRDTLRTMDVIARFGGEEFLILLPETTIEDAAATITRLQRELTRHFFMHEHNKLVLTFSAGVALRLPNEEQLELVRRADRAMYQAKQSGKNRVVVAE